MKDKSLGYSNAIQFQAVQQSYKRPTPPCHSIMDLTLTLLLTLTTATAFEIVDHSENVAIMQGSSGSLFCQSDEPYEFCRWIHDESGTTCRISSDNIDTIQTCGGDDHIEWELDTHRCGIKINGASRSSDVGKFKCSLNGGEELRSASATTDVDVYVPALVTFEGDFGPEKNVAVDADQTVEFVCVAEGGYPAPDLKAALGEDADIMYSDFDLQLNYYEDKDEMETDEDGIVTLKRTFHFQPKQHDCGKFVKCEAIQVNHEGNPLQDESEISSRKITVQFPPQPFEEEPAPIVFFDGEKFVNIKLIFQASPIPLDSQVIWHINPSGGDAAAEDSIVLSADRVVDDKYRALSLNTSGHNVMAILQISDPQPEMMSWSYYLEVHTEKGSQKYPFTLLHLKEPEHEDPLDDTSTTLDYETEGMSTGLVAVIVVVVVIGLGIVFGIFIAKKNQLCCFKYNPVPTEADKAPKEPPIIKNGSEHNSDEKDGGSAV